LFAGHCCCYSRLAAVSTEEVEGLFGVTDAEDVHFYYVGEVAAVDEPDMGTLTAYFIAYFYSDFDDFVAFVSVFIGGTVDAMVVCVVLGVACPIIHLPSTRVYPP
jgi:hypothetical protein